MTKQPTFAAIDTGTNAVRLMIKRVDNNELKKGLLLRVPLRLGFDVFKYGRVTEENVLKFRRLMKAFKHLMNVYGVTAYRAVATSAMRDANNGGAIIAKVQKDTGINIEIISGAEEAKIIYSNHKSGDGNYIYVDVGGGSTEINIMLSGQLVGSFSYNIGTIRILSEAVNPVMWEKMEEDLRRLTTGVEDISIVGSGGNINKLFTIADQKDEQRNMLPVESLEELYKLMEGMTIEERIARFGFKRERADVIVPASRIFLTVAKIVGATKIYVPFIGLGDGIINDLWEKYKMYKV